MSKDKIMAPEMDLIKKDEFYLFYEMMMQSLKTDNVKEGINKSLALLKNFLNSGHIALYRKNDDGKYVFRISDSDMKELTSPIGCIVNKTKELTEQNEIFNLKLELTERLNDLMFIHMNIENADCMFVIINKDKTKELEPHFWNRTKDTLQIILKRAASYERNTKAITTDLLTNLDNRNSYEMRTQEINEADNDLVLGIFDLFRLKHINDNYTHAKGDVYIKEVARILNKYWPKEKITTNDDATEIIENTGHCVYRVGGDEFVLLTNVETLQLAKIKAELAATESSIIRLDIDDDIPLGINYGLVKHTPGDSLKQTFMKADEIMQEDKRKMYVKYNLERRR